IAWPARGASRMRDRECSHARGSLRAGGEGGCVLPRARLDARSRHETRVAVRSSSGIQTRSSLERPPALVAQLDRAPDFESGVRGWNASERANEIRAISEPYRQLGTR